LAPRTERRAVTGKLCEGRTRMASTHRSTGEWREPDDDGLFVILELVASAEAEDRPLSVAQVAGALGMSDDGAEAHMERVEDVGLALTGLKEPGSPILLRAGRQYLQRGGRVDARVLEYLPHTIDDLHAREALLRAGTVLVHHFRPRRSPAAASNMPRRSSPGALNARSRHGSPSISTAPRSL
jgi:hypothetical protein